MNFKYRVVYLTIVIRKKNPSRSVTGMVCSYCDSDLWRYTLLGFDSSKRFRRQFEFARRSIHRKEAVLLFRGSRPSRNKPEKTPFRMSAEQDAKETSFFRNFLIYNIFNL
ncbi:hypothetical protein DLM75_22880 [Leptospira stimsonii]|uniref:Uncharacterized protein n=1 Tax=Leptospira stimsonii TaxID=2202203 RepID=A0A396YQK6_9LEPT|nr:hypothetical protein DLM75_22880 [Leptospira stimsonii]